VNAGTADKGSMVDDVRGGGNRDVRRRERQRGQALVEFALLLPLFVLLVVGIIQFAVGLNYWLDMQRIANQGARWAVVNNWPTCPRGSTSCPHADQEPFTRPQTLQQVLYGEILASGLTSTATIQICYPDDGSPTTPAEEVGTPVRVKVTAPYDFLPVVGKVGSMTLRAEATMRLEQKPTLVTGEVACS
jgi:TadE-like protein